MSHPLHNCVSDIPAMSMLNCSSSSNSISSCPSWCSVHSISRWKSVLSLFSELHILMYDICHIAVTIHTHKCNNKPSISLVKLWLPKLVPGQSSTQNQINCGSFKKVYNIGIFFHSCICFVQKPAYGKGTVAPRRNAPRYYADSDITRSVVGPDFLPPGVKWLGF